MPKPKPVIQEAAILITDQTSTLRYFLVCKKKNTYTYKPRKSMWSKDYRLSFPS